MPISNWWAPDVGAYLALFEATTGVRPTKICGKPSASMITGVLDELGLEPVKCAMIGDRIYTDMAMARASGVHGVLVLSGEATQDDASPRTWSSVGCPIGSVID